MNEQITKRELKQIHPRFVDYYEGFNKTMNRFDIDTLERKCSFLAQISHETGAMKWLTEIWGPTQAQKGYEGRQDLGNTQEGDGYRYRGRGAIMYTGRYNYKQLSKVLKPDFISNPNELSQDPWAILSAGVYWHKHDINEPADRRDHKEVTRRINGGLNGFKSRLQWYNTIQDILSQQSINPVPTDQIGVVGVYDPIEHSKIKEVKKKNDKTLIEIAIPNDGGFELSDILDFYRNSDVIQSLFSVGEEALLQFVPLGDGIDRLTDSLSQSIKNETTFNINKTIHTMANSNKKKKRVWGIIAAVLGTLLTAIGIGGLDFHFLTNGLQAADIPAILGIISGIVSHYLHKDADEDHQAKMASK